MMRLLPRLERFRPAQYAGCLLLSRLLLLAALYAITGGHELSNDTPMHMGMIRQPLSVLLHSIPEYAQNPPLLPFLETVAGYPLQLRLNDFLSLRLVMIGYETVLGLLFFLLLNALKLPAGHRRLCLWGFLLLPMGWMTSVVMAQDEVIAAVAFVLPVLLWVRGYERAAILACGIGVIAGKLFIGVELLSLIALSDSRTWIRRACLGFSPVVLTYGVMTLYQLSTRHPLPLVGFRPDPSYGINFWIVLKTYANVDLRSIGPYSGVAALLVSMLAPVLAWRTGVHRSDPSLVVVTVSTSLMWFFALFYHVNPEYLIMTLPLMLATAVSRADAWACVLLAVLPWAGKFFQNAVFMSKADLTPGKQIALRYFHAIFQSDPAAWLLACQIAVSVLLFAVSIRGCVRLLQSAAARELLHRHRVGGH